MAGLKLLVALDVLLVEGSIGRAAARLGMSAPAMSRLLAQIRERFGDPIFIRTGRGMVPTPYAENLRARLRVIAAEAEALLNQTPSNLHDSPSPPGLASAISTGTITPPAETRMALPEGIASLETINRSQGEMRRSSNPSMRLARHIATTGAGAGRTRPLTMAEADDAMSIILRREADPIQIGALLVALQCRGATSPEIAGFTRAVRRECNCASTGSHCADLDWPAYVSPRRVSPPWFLLAARLVALAGHRVLLHGLGSPNPAIEGTLKILGIRTAADLPDAIRHLQTDNIAYLPLPRLSSQLSGLLGLYHYFQMRSPLNAVVHLVNPLGARNSLIGAPGTASAEILRKAAGLADATNLTVLTTCRDAAQATPFRAMPLLRLKEGNPQEVIIPSLQKAQVNMATGLTTMEYVEAIWNGTERDHAATAIIQSTITLALYTLGKYPTWVEARSEAERLWKERRKFWDNWSRRDLAPHLNE